MNKTELKEKIYQYMCSHLTSCYKYPDDYVEVSGGIYRCKVDYEVFIDKNKFEGRPYILECSTIVSMIDELDSLE